LNPNNSTSRILGNIPLLKPRAVNIFQRNAVIESLFLLVREVSQPVPLARDLGVEGPDIVVYGPGMLMDNLLVKKRAVEE
jgi:hypothetical protein